MRCILIAILVLASSQAHAQKSSEEQIQEAVRALPEALRAEATVVGYGGSGKRVTLRNGNNGMTCWADDPKPNLDEPYYVLCFPESLKQFFTRNHELKESGVADRRKVLTEEIESGKIAMPKLDIRYTIRGQEMESALPLTVIHVPYMTAKDTGFSAELDHFRPWLMMEGTPFAHIMVPGH